MMSEIPPKKDRHKNRKKYLADGSINPFYNGDGHKQVRSGSRHKRKSNIQDFCSWDGEGYDKEGNHIYSLLMNDRGTIVIDEKGISTEKCFDTLLSFSLANPDLVHCVFGASYDINMWIKDIDFETCQKLFHGHYTMWKEYAVVYRPRKSIFIAKFKNVEKRFIDKKPDYESKILIWDVFGFFQGSFVKALKKYFNEKELKELSLEKIIEGKNHRGCFTPHEIQNFIIPYTTCEVHALTQLMNRLRDNLKQANICVSRWDGAGAIASAIFKREGIKGHIPTDIPKDIHNAALHAYGGGRIESILYGHFSRLIYHYDINSAYPSAMRSLPDLSSGYWVSGHRSLHENKPFSIFLVSWNFDNPTLPKIFPFFNRGKDGAIDYPQIGLNWVWYPELKAFIDTHKNWKKYVTIVDGYCFMPETNNKPFSFIDDLFEQRRKWKEEGNGAEKVIKLGVNSFYGKTVQQLGWAIEANGNLKIPSYYCIEYGGYLTSDIRSRLYRASMQKPNSIIAFSTDGIWSLEPLKLSLGSGLGEWEYDTLDGLTLAQSGVYWTHKKGEGNNCPIHSNCTQGHWYRGFSPEYMKEEQVLDAWKNGLTSIKIPTKRFTTLGTSLASKERFNTLWRKWLWNDRTLKIRCEGSKRTDVKQEGSVFVTRARTHPHAKEIKDEAVWPIDIKHISTPHKEPWNNIGIEILQEMLLQEQLDIEYQESEW